MLGDPMTPGSQMGQSGPDPKTALFLQALLNPAGIPDNSNQAQPNQSMLMEAISRKLNEGAPQADPNALPAGPDIKIGNDLSSLIPPNTQSSAPPPPMQPMPPPQGNMPPSPMPQQPMPQDVPQGVGSPQPPQMMAPGINGQYQATGAYGQPIDPQALQQLLQNPDPLTQMMMGGGSGR